MKLNISARKRIARLIELEDLYLSIQAVSGYAAEQILDLLLSGYTLEPPK